MDRFPESQYVLIGDSGEKDPEVFATLLRRNGKDGKDGKINYAARIKHVFIRNVTDDLPTSARYQPIGDKLRLFKTPSELPLSLRETRCGGAGPSSGLPFMGTPEGSFGKGLAMMYLRDCKP